MMPSIVIGAFTMYRNEVSIMRWMQNIICFLLLSVISLFIVKGKHNINKNKDKRNIITISMALCFLILTFLFPGMEGVHRWVSLGFIRVNAAIIVLPLILIALWHLVQTKGVKIGFTITIGIVLLLLFQPDASQLTGFAIPAMIMLFSKVNSKTLRLLIASIFSIFVISSWVYLDNLPPVDYVERIVYMVANMGNLWLFLGIISLIILPLPFLLFPPKNAELLSSCIGIYFIIVIISTLFGNFPVPLMGYGISPIIGYFISIIWYTNWQYSKFHV